MQLEESRDLPNGKTVELGSGGGFFKEIFPEALTSDISDFPWTDMTFSGLDMPFQNQEVAAIFMLDTFHHFPRPEEFLREASRILVPGGKIIMIEPANSTWGRFIYRRFHHEPFEPTSTWTFPETGPLAGANGALPWIIFDRDRQKFEEKFPELRIEKISHHTPFRYLLSGGVSLRSLAPAFSFGVFTTLDRVASWLSPQISMFQTIVIRKI